MKDVREVEDVKPICDTRNMERNVYALIGRVSQTLHAAGMDKRAQEFVWKSMPVSDYGKLVTLSQDFVEFRNEGDVNVSNGNHEAGSIAGEFDQG